jgi:hypothetical protein
MYPRNMVCFRCIIVHILHKGDNKDNNNNNNNSFMKTLCIFTYHTDFTKIRSEEISYDKFVARPLKKNNCVNIWVRFDSLVAMTDSTTIF